MKNEQTHRKFILFIAVFQVAVVAIFCVFVRYDEELDSLFHANRTTGTSDGVMDNQYHSKYFSFHFPYSKRSSSLSLNMYWIWCLIKFVSWFCCGLLNTIEYSWFEVLLYINGQNMNLWFWNFFGPNYIHSFEIMFFDTGESGLWPIFSFLNDLAKFYLF